MKTFDKALLTVRGVQIELRNVKYETVPELPELGGYYHTVTAEIPAHIEEGTPVHFVAFETGFTGWASGTELTDEVWRPIEITSRLFLPIEVVTDVALDEDGKLVVEKRTLER